MRRYAVDQFVLAVGLIFCLPLSGALGLPGLSLALACGIILRRRAACEGQHERGKSRRCKFRNMGHHSILWLRPSCWSSLGVYG